MQNLSRRKLLGGSAALAVAAVLPAREGQTFIIRPAGANTGPPMPDFIYGELESILLDLRPGAVTWARPEWQGERLIMNFIPKTYDDKIRAGYTVADGGDGVLVWLPPRGSM